MSWYYGTFSCGHEGRVNITGPTKNRQWIADKKFGGMCEECYAEWLESEKVRKNKEALEAAKEMELPELTGSEKQVAWANTLRNDFIDNIEKMKNEDEKFKSVLKYDYNFDNKKINSIVANLDNVLEDIMIKTEAKWFIDTRMKLVSTVIKIADEIINNDDVENIIKQEVIKEGTISPTDAKYDGIAEIRVTEDSIVAVYEKNNTFIEILRSLNYKWNGTWERNLDETTGSCIDRAAELGNKLLNAGFTICILDENIRKKAINGEYEAECARWIYARKNTTNLAINWEGYDNNLYNAAKKLKSSKWDNPSMLVNVTNYKEVEEFAEMFGFKFTKKATQLIKNYKDQLEGVEKVVAADAIEQPIKDGLNDILSSSREILDDLKEDD